MLVAVFWCFGQWFLHRWRIPCAKNEHVVYKKCMNRESLKEEDREFFGLVAQAAVANPFSEERHSLDLRVGQSSPGTPREQAVDASIARLKARVEGLPSGNLEAYGPSERRILELSLLFEVFHDYGPDMDALVQRQLGAGEQHIDVPFAEAMLRRLIAHGVPVGVAQRWLCLLYQMRRAYFFIHTRLVGRSLCMQELRQRIWANIFTQDLSLYEERLWNRMEDFSTFLVGETGTGKGTAAAALGYSGWLPYDAKAERFERSFTESFVPINLSQFPPSLIESELFGHRKGAFTGAIDDFPGVFGRCHRQGVIFLDEIGEVELNVQVKLLRVLQERVYSPVGSRQIRRFEGRVVAATNQSVPDLRSRGKFRDDLYYRLCSDIIEIPPLRLRIRQEPAELESLLTYIVDQMVGPTPGLVDRVLTVIEEQLPEDYPWPGNVRELEQCVRRVVMAQEYRGDQMVAEVGDGDSMKRLYREMEAETIEARDVLARYCQILYERHENYQEVARLTGLDRRTVTRYVQDGL